MIESGSGFRVVKKPTEPPAVAVSAVSAVWQGTEAARTAKKATATAEISFLPESPSRTATTTVGVAGDAAVLPTDRIESGVVEVEI